MYSATGKEQIKLSKEYRSQFFCSAWWIFLYEDPSVGKKMPICSEIEKQSVIFKGISVVIPKKMFFVDFVGRRKKYILFSSGNFPPH